MFCVEYRFMCKERRYPQSHSYYSPQAWCSNGDIGMELISTRHRSHLSETRRQFRQIGVNLITPRPSSLTSRQPEAPPRHGCHSMDTMNGNLPDGIRVIHTASPFKTDDPQGCTVLETEVRLDIRITVEGGKSTTAEWAIPASKNIHQWSTPLRHRKTCKIYRHWTANAEKKLNQIKATYVLIT